jgi:preprotein translocase subunit SecG
MTTYKSTSTTEIIWGIYFLVLSYFLVSFYSTFNLADETMLPSYSLNYPGCFTPVYPKWFAIIYVWTIFLAGKGLLFIASSISKKGVRVTLYWIASLFFIIPIVMCLHLTYMKRQFEKSCQVSELMESRVTSDTTDL